MNEPLRQRDPRVEDAKYLARIRELPCCVCGRPGPSDAAHIRMSDAAWGGHWGKRSTGMQEKPSDRWALPLCRPSYRPDDIAALIKHDEPRRLVDIGCHGRQHGHDHKFFTKEQLATEEFRDSCEQMFWTKVSKNPFQIANMLYQKFGTVKDEQASRYKRKRKSRTKKPDAKKQTIPSRPMPTGRKFPKRKKP